MRYLPLILFFSFICWIIFDANMGDSNILIELVEDVPYGDKMGHFLLYGILAFILNLTLDLKTIKYGGTELLMGSVIVLAFTVVEEFTQIPLRERNFELLDLSSNVLGIAFFSVLAMMVGNRRVKTAKKTYL